MWHYSPAAENKIEISGGRALIDHWPKKNILSYKDPIDELSFEFSSTSDIRKVLSDRGTEAEFSNSGDPQIWNFWIKINLPHKKPLENLYSKISSKSDKRKILQNLRS